MPELTGIKEISMMHPGESNYETWKRLSKLYRKEAGLFYQEIKHDLQNGYFKDTKITSCYLTFKDYEKGTRGQAVKDGFLLHYGVDPENQEREVTIYAIGLFTLEKGHVILNIPDENPLKIYPSEELYKKLVDSMVAAYTKSDTDHKELSKELKEDSKESEEKRLAAEKDTLLGKGRHLIERAQIFLASDLKTYENKNVSNLIRVLKIIWEKKITQSPDESSYLQFEKIIDLYQDIFRLQLNLQEKKPGFSLLSVFRPNSLKEKALDQMEKNLITILEESVKEVDVFSEKLYKKIEEQLLQTKASGKLLARGYSRSGGKFSENINEVIEKHKDIFYPPTINHEKKRFP